MQNTQEQKPFKRLFITLAVSLVFHYLVFDLLGNLKGIQLFPEISPKAKQDLVEIDLVPKQKIRNIGIKNGSKSNSVYLGSGEKGRPTSKQQQLQPKKKTSQRPVRPASMAKRPTIKKIQEEKPLAKNEQASKKQPSEAVSLSQMGISSNQLGSFSYTEKRKKNSKHIPGQFSRFVKEISPTVTANKLVGISSHEIGNLSKNIVPTFNFNHSPNLLDEQYFLKSSDLNILFEVPEGVDPSNLNRKEMVFYGFRKRIAESFVSSLLNSYQKFKVENPHIKIPERNSNEHLMGKVTYDRNGNIKVIRFVKWSQLDNTQEFFDKVLKELKTLPNPPKDILNSSEEFNVYYSLLIDNRG